MKRIITHDKCYILNGTKLDLVFLPKRTKQKTKSFSGGNEPDAYYKFQTYGINLIMVNLKSSRSVRSSPFLFLAWQSR